MSSSHLDYCLKTTLNQQELSRCKPQRGQTEERSSAKQVRSVVGVGNTCRHRSNMNSRAKIQRNEVSPSHSVLTNQNHFKEMEAVMLSQNSNLRQHNVFLKKQIETMFNRERHYKKNLLLSRERVRELESINRCLQDHIQRLISNFMQEISRIQNIINQEKSQHNISLQSSVFATNHKYETASETQSTIHKDLEELKTKVRQIYENFQFADPIHLKLEQGKSSNPVTPSFKEESNLDKYIYKQGNSRPQDYYPQLPSTLVKRQKNPNQRASKNKLMKTLK